MIPIHQRTGDLTRNEPREALVTVGVSPGDVQGGLLTERHLWDENVPPFDELTDTDVCLEWLAAVDGAVKLLAAVERAVVVLCVVSITDTVLEG